MPRATLVLALGVLVALAGAEDEPEQATCEDGDSPCTMPGSSVLQWKNSLLRTGSSEEVGEEEEEEGADALEGLALFGATVENHAGHQLIIHDDSEVATTGKGMWVITVPSKCTTATVNKMAEHMPNGTVPEFKGDPSAGGLCVFIMKGSKEEVKEELTTHDWPSKPIVETDKVWQAIPEIPGGSDGLDAAGKREQRAVTSSSDGRQANPPWGLDRIDDAQGLDRSYFPSFSYNEGEGVHVYVADTGVRTTHSDFGGRAVPTLEVVSSTPKVCHPTDTTCADDVHGHGTHCAGTVGGSTYGVAKKATVHAVQVLADSGAGSFSWFIEAIDWVMANGQVHNKPSIFSASLGGKGHVRSVDFAIQKAVSGGLTIVVAAGNEGTSDTPDACKYSPAFVPAAITVGATQSDDKRARYSNYGKCLDIYAPGSGVQSAGHRSDTSSAIMSGTSMACPHVAGAAALILGEDKSRTPADVLKVMLDRAITGKVQDAKLGSPNLLLYTGPYTAPEPTPTPPPAPQPTPPPAPQPTPPPSPQPTKPPAPNATKPPAPNATKPPAPNATKPPAPEPSPSGNLTCSFEEPGFTGPCSLWTQVEGDDFDWTRHSGRTPTPWTGPTEAFDGNYYMYIETSTPRTQNQRAILRSSPLQVSDGMSFTFAYSMHGRNVEALEVKVANKRVFIRRGSRGRRWRTAKIDLRRFRGQKVVIDITAWAGEGAKGNIAIDKLQIMSPGALAQA